MIMWESDPRNGAKGFGVSFLFGFSLSLIQYVLFILLFLLEWKYLLYATVFEVCDVFEILG